MPAAFPPPGAQTAAPPSRLAMPDSSSPRPSASPLPARGGRRLREAVWIAYSSLVFVVVIFLLTCPLILVLPTLRLRRQAGRAGVRVAMALIGSPLRLEGREHLPATPCIVAANHASYLDGLVLTAVLPPWFTFAVKDDAAKWPYIGAVLRRMGVVFIDRRSARAGAEQTRRLIRMVEGGESLGIFPEGTFAAEPGLLPLKKGAFVIAGRTQAPVVPCVITGTRELFGLGARRLHPSRVRIRLLPAVPPGDADALREATEQALAAELGRAARTAA